ncbi:two-component regulator propeller domain-containing protein [Pontibacter sp. G13]|uniref:hybrid sensor histidine kinase/response regulator transcription factor n=1 Tax=Pontibacter sp. G13 TaxID=3074898 RepID=UPI00288B6FF4|nr:two-component regulator propeller domain-containing protein [Pontibacter sp. G13]WNJ20586.1 two-component regulator propeller domain-containing protein [Pontibacter sp. G13]
MSRLLILCLWGILGWLLLIPAQATPTLPFLHEFAPDGKILNQPVNSMLIDRSGYLWIGSFSGLYRYDGASVIQYTHDAQDSHSLLNNNVTNLLEDRHGQIWITSESGLSCFNPQTRKFQSWLGLVGKQLILDEQGHVLMVQRDGQQVIRITPESQQGEALKREVWLSESQFQRNAKRLWIEQVEQDPLGRWWIGTNRGLWSWNTDEQPKRTSIRQPISTMRIDPSQRYLWMGTRGPRLIKCALPTNRQDQPTRLGEKDLLEDNRIEVRDLSIESSGRLWVATSRGICLLEASESLETAEVLHMQADESRIGGLPSDHVSCLLKDASHSLWIGTLQGIRQYKQQPFEWNLLKLNPDNYVPLNQIIHSACVDSEGSLWVGTPNDGIFRKKVNERQFEHIAMPKGGVREIVQTQSGDLLIASHERIFRLKNPTRTDIQARDWELIKTFENTVIDLLEVSPNLIWVGQWKVGVSVLNLKTLEESEGPLAENELYGTSLHIGAMTKDRQGTIWVGTRGYGVYQLHPDGRQVRYYNFGADDGDLSYGVLGMFEDARGRVWIGTRGGGLFRYAPDRSGFEHFTVEDGLPSMTVTGITEDQFGRVWVGTEQGLALYLPEEPMPFIDYGVTDGMLNTHFNYNSLARTHDGIFFGCNNGIYHLMPKSLPYAPGNPNLVISHFQVFNPNQDQPDLIQPDADIDAQLKSGNVALEHDRNSFEIHLSALDFAAPEKIKYAYRLVGLEEAWHFTRADDRVAKYVQVPAGNYRFEVMCSDSKGYWTRQSISLPIEIKPAFWMTKTAFVMYGLIIGLVLIGVVLLVWKWEGLQRRLRKAALERARQDSNIHYFSDLSHEIRNRLTLIMGPLEKVLAENPDKVQMETVQKIYQNALRLKRLTDEIMNLRKSDMGAFRLRAGRGDILQFLKRIKTDMDDVATVKQIHYHFESRETEILAWFDQQLVEIITLNLLSNAFKYSGEHGTIRVRVASELLAGDALPNANMSAGAYTRLEVIDNGNGISPSDLERIFEPYTQAEVSKEQLLGGTGLGLDLVVRLVRLHHGEIAAESKPGETRITVWIPAAMELYDPQELHRSAAEMDGPQVDHASGDIPEEQANLAEAPLVLIAEDDPELRHMLAESLGAEFRIITAADGAEGYELAKRESPDLILSDMIMPGTDGLAFLKQVRGNKSLNDVPFVVLTARYSEEQRLACIQHDADDFLEKPFRMEFLRWRIRNLLSNRMLLKEKYGKVITVEPKVVEVQSPEDQFIQQVVDLLEAHIDASWLSVEFLASEMSMSRATFYRRMEEIMQDSPSNFIKQFRLKRALQLLKQQSLNISEVAYRTGFKSPRYFSKCFQKEFGLSPSAYLKQLKEGEPVDEVPS